MDDTTQVRKIWCSVVGDADGSTAFRVCVSNGGRVLDLKEKIYHELEGRRRFEGLSASKLVLWKLMVPTPLESFTPPGDDNKLSEIAVKLENPAAKASTLGLSDKGFQILIQKWSPRTKDSTLYGEDWSSKIWAAGWGKPAALTHPSGCLFIPAGPWSFEPILVRKEYEEIWDCIEKRRSRLVKHLGGLVVWGQPLIGKSYFLLFALAKALECKYPVAFCNRSDSFYFFNKHGPQFIPLAALRPGALPENTLVLCDFQGRAEQPPIYFTNMVSTAFVVQATSPGVVQWKGWWKQRCAEVWTMNPWSEGEVIAASQIYPDQVPTGCYSPLELFHLLGPSARHFLHTFGNNPWKNTGDPKRDFGPILNPSFLFADVNKLVWSMTAGDLPEGYDFHEFFYASRPPAATNPQRLPQFTYNVPTKFLRRVLSAALIKTHLRLQNPNAGALAGVIYEPVVMKKLSSPGDALRCQLLNGSHFDLPSQLKVSKATTSFDEPLTPQNDTLYTTPLAFPSIHAVAITDQGQRVTLLHMTTEQKHSVALDGIEKISSSPELTVSTVRWAFIFVTPSAEKGRALSTAAQSIQVARQAEPRKDKRGASPPTSMTQIDVGWAVVEQPGKTLQAVIASLSENAKTGP